MSTHQQSKPRAANQSMAEESGRTGTCKSNVGVEAMDEPCTNRIVPAGPDGSPAYFSHRNSRTSLPLLVQCSSPRITALAGLFIAYSDRQDCTGGAAVDVRLNALHCVASIS